MKQEADDFMHTTLIGMQQFVLFVCFLKESLFVLWFVAFIGDGQCTRLAGKSGFPIVLRTILDT